MASSTLLCIHRDPAQLSLLKKNGYRLLTATTGHEGIRLSRSRTVDAIVIEHHVAQFDGAAIAAQIKRARPQIPIVMLADLSELRGEVLDSGDAVVSKGDGAHLLWATVHFVLNVNPTRPHYAKKARNREGSGLGKTRTDGSDPRLARAVG